MDLLELNQVNLPNPRQQWGIRGKPDGMGQAQRPTHPQMEKLGWPRPIYTSKIPWSNESIPFPGEKRN